MRTLLLVFFICFIYLVATVIPGSKAPAAFKKKTAQNSFTFFPSTPLVKTECPKTNHLLLEGDIDTFSVTKALHEIKCLEKEKHKSMVLEINSMGGRVDEGFKLSKALERTSMKITCIVDGDALSMAFYILQSCHERQMTKRSTLMIHSTSLVGYTNGNAVYFQEFADWLKASDSAMCEHLASRMKISADTLRHRILHGSWYFGWKEAKRYGAVDRVINRVPKS